MSLTPKLTGRTNQLYPKKPGTTDGVSILIVDDSPVRLQTIAFVLQDMGYKQIQMAANGLEAIERIEQGPTVHIIFTDLQMPECDGLELIEHLGQRQYDGSIIIHSQMEKRIVDLTIELARRQSLYLVGYLDQNLEPTVIQSMVDRALLAARNYNASDLASLSKEMILRAIENKNIVPYFQPKIDNKTECVVGFEVLCRLVHPISKEIITPDRFIDAAERAGLMMLLTLALLEKAALEFNLLCEEFPDLPLTLSINLSPGQLDDDKLPSTFNDLCQIFQLPPTRITLEITETDLIEKDTRLKNLARLRMMGFGCSLDDYGMGFTSLAQLEHYPFSEVKLDRSYINNIASDPYAQQLCDKLVDKCTANHMQMVAEGLERADDVEYLSRYHNIHLQGYLYSPPKPYTDIRRWLHNWEAHRSINP